MSIARLSMQSTPMLREFHNQTARQSIKSNHHVLRLSSSQPRLEMKTTHGQIRIDQSQCFAEAGLKSIGEMIADNASFSRQKLIESIGKITDQGNQIADIYKGDPIPDQASYNAYEQFIREWNMVTMPTSRPKIDFVGGEVDITVIEGKVENQSRPEKPQIEYIPGKLDIYVKQYNKLEITVVDAAV